MESYALGLGEPIQISAEHGEGLSDLYVSLRALMPEPVVEEEPAGLNTFRVNWTTSLVSSIAPNPYTTSLPSATGPTAPVPPRRAREPGAGARCAGRGASRERLSGAGLGYTPARKRRRRGGLR